LEQSPHNQLARISHSADETRAIGAELAGHLAAGDLICLYGDLGAGKTTFIQGLASGLGVSDRVTSPSFTLVHDHRCRLLFYHLDLYRLGPGDLTEAGIEEVLSAPAVAAVEWAERLPEPLRRGALELHIAFDDDNPDSRRLRFRSLGERSARLIAALTEVPDAPSRS